MSNLLSRHFLSMAYNNAWSNHRLLKACALLSQPDFVAHRTSFFPSIKATLNHNLTVDWFYIDALVALAGALGFNTWQRHRRGMPTGVLETDRNN